MKNLVLIRHAKSSWKDINLTDFKRPLKKRGKRDAPMMGKLLKKMSVMPDLVLSSPAVRAAETAKIICNELGIPVENISYKEDIYEAASRDLLGILSSVHKTVDTVFMFGHNPGLTDLSNYLSDRYIDNIPTTGIVSLNFNYADWSQLTGGSCTLNYFEFPKKYYPRKEND